MLSEVEHTLDVPIASGDRRVTVSVQDSIAGFAADYLSSSTGTIQIMVPHGSPNAGAASAVRKQIRQVLTTRGVPSNKIIETSYQAEANSNAAPVRISYVAITAMTNPCGEWPEDLQDNTFSNKNYHNFGCATQSNLAAQIAQTQATLQADEARLGYTRIFAPMAGTVVSVDAREGQTLNATYQTPNVLRIADLSSMTVWSEVSEADVRRVKPGMAVYFTTL
eukprot:gene1582-1837_t